MHFTGYETKEVEVNAFVFVGLFNNLATASFCGRSGETGSSFYRESPLTLTDSPVREERRLVVRAEEGLMPFVLGADVDNVSGPVPAVVTRLRFIDASVCIVGGFSSLGTVKIADYVARLQQLWPVALRQLVDRPDDNFVAFLDTPPSGERFVDDYKYRSKDERGARSSENSGPVSWQPDEMQSLHAVAKQLRDAGAFARS